MRDRSRPVAALSLGAAGVVLGGVAPAGQDVSVMVSGLRNGRGLVRACLTTNVALFPNCKDDPQAHKLEVPAAPGQVLLDFGKVPPGTYAFALIHDENANGRIDTALMVPREGFGFSRDAKVRFGPPRFSAAAFAVTDGPVRQTVRVRYIF
ncbi:DUF2141 domain-containing protein [Novosphingobium piscinae]|uniref:DUF2141 domain-containing protein n=1 Tax=Novosphingobium piscinae TaxID=1507448 RepID=UPI0031B5E6E2